MEIRILLPEERFLQMETCISQLAQVDKDMFGIHPILILVLSVQK